MVCRARVRFVKMYPGIAPKCAMYRLYTKVEVVMNVLTEQCSCEAMEADTEGVCSISTMLTKSAL